MRPRHTAWLSVVPDIGQLSNPKYSICGSRAPANLISIDIVRWPGILTGRQNQAVNHTTPKNWPMPGYLIAKNALRAILLVLICLGGAQRGFAGPLDFSSDDTVTVSAEKAWEDDQVNVIHFSGKFELRAPDWLLAGDAATVYGKLDNPDRVVVSGGPAKISFLRAEDNNSQDAAKDERIDGTAHVIEYFRASDRVKMRGAATLLREDSTLASEVIEYDVGADRYSAGGEGGINAQFRPDDN